MFSFTPEARAAAQLKIADKQLVSFSKLSKQIRIDPADFLAIEAELRLAHQEVTASAAAGCTLVVTTGLAAKSMHCAVAPAGSCAFDNPDLETWGSWLQADRLRQHNHRLIAALSQYEQQRTVGGYSSWVQVPSHFVVHRKKICLFMQITSAAVSCKAFVLAINEANNPTAAVSCRMLCPHLRRTSGRC